MTDKIQFLAPSKNGVKVFYDPIGSHAATHFEDTPNLQSLVIEIIGNLELNGQEIACDFDMGRVVGVCDVVAVDKADEIVYGMRKNRADDGLVPFAKNRQGDPCRLVAIHLVPQADGSYILSSAWIGTFGEDDEPFPLSSKATERSAEFWDRHAFVYGSQEIIAGTETTVKSW